MIRPQAGRFSRLTASQMTDLRETERLYRTAERARDELRVRLGLSKAVWRNYVTGQTGKKPRQETA